MSTFAQAVLSVIVGVDTHKDKHVAVALDQLGRRLGELICPATAAGYAALLSWAKDFGPVESFGIEGTGSYGAGLARFLARQDNTVIEINRPDRSARRSHGKSDPVDAEAAARSVLSGKATTIPKESDDQVEMIRLLKNARQGAVKARTQAMITLQSIVVSAPESLRQQLRELKTPRLVKVASSMRPGDIIDPTAAAKTALRSVGRRVRQLDIEIKRLDKQLNELVAAAAPTTLATFGVGIDVASTLLVAAGENPERLQSEAAFASLCGVSPVEASSGKTVRHRLNRGGNRRANAAIYTVVICRMRYDERTKEYVERRTGEGKSKREINRCLKRYVAREIYRCLLADRKHRMLQKSSAKAA